MTTLQLVLVCIAALLSHAFGFWMGHRAGRKAAIKETVGYVLSRPAPLRSYEERMLEFAKLESKRPSAGRIII